jgi:hypothetical protein
VRDSRAAFNSIWRGALAGALLAVVYPNCALHAQQVYRSVDADGHVVYSDRGESKTAATTSLHVEEGNPAEAARLAKEQELLKAEDAQRSKQQALEEKTKETADHKQQQACQSSRNKYYQLRDSGRIYQRAADGTRSYYSDEDADAMREQARKAMVAACGS